MDNQNQTLGQAWNTAPSAKEKSAVQRSVNQVLDALAPERLPKRGEAVSGAIERHRTPKGCVLQAESAAVSVSWFVDNRGQTLGELHINIWDGVVSRGGSSHRRPTKAALVSELVVRPIEASSEDCVWRADDGREFDSRTLTTHCLALLDEQIQAGSR